MFRVTIFLRAATNAFHYEGMWTCCRTLSSVSAVPRRVWQAGAFYGLTNACFPKSGIRKPANTFPHQSIWEHSGADGMCQHSDAPLSRKSGGVAETKTGAEPRRLTQQSGSATPSRSTHLSGASHPSSQSIRRRPTVILFVQINNEIAAAPHRGTQRVVIAAFQAGSDGLCGRLARLHCDLVCVCNFPQA